MYNIIYCRIITIKICEFKEHIKKNIFIRRNYIMRNMRKIYKLKIDNNFSNSNDIIHEMDCRFFKKPVYGNKI